MESIDKSAVGPQDQVTFSQTGAGWEGGYYFFSSPFMCVQLTLCGWVWKVGVGGGVPNECNSHSMSITVPLGLAVLKV